MLWEQIDSFSGTTERACDKMSSYCKNIPEIWTNSNPGSSHFKVIGGATYEAYASKG